MSDELAFLILAPILFPLAYLFWRWFSWYTDMDTVRRHLREARERSKMRKAAVSKLVNKFWTKIFFGK
ncbi:hypothetical protein ES703_80569 [subsurface metagenome]